jgi:hypothetical protein
MALSAAVASGGQFSTVDDDGWCREGGEGRDARYCEVREVTLPAGRDVIRVDAEPNGGINVEGWDRNEIRIAVKVVARAKTEAEAQEVASRVQIDTTNTIRADGPSGSNRTGWWVSFRLWVPASSNLELESNNGGISIENVSGAIEFRTTNGGVHLTDLAGDVRGRTTNGGVDVRLAGAAWDGEGLEAVTTNGGVRLAIPEGYNAHLETGTTNGGIHVDFPITVQGRIKRQLSTDLGEGGRTVRVMTTNGGVKIRRR